MFLACGASAPRSDRELLLKKCDIALVHHTLRKAVVYISHCENRTTEQTKLEVHFRQMTVQLFVMAIWTHILAHRYRERQQLREYKVALT